MRYLILLVLTVTACAKGYLTENFPAEQLPADESAMLYVLRSPTIFASFDRKSIFLDGWEVAKLSTDQYFYTSVTPGRHSVGLGTGGLTIDLAVGDTAYFYISPDGMSDNFEIERLTRERAEELMSGATDLTKRARQPPKKIP